MANVLFIEPNPLLLQAYTESLMLAGHAVQAVPGAQEAVHAADDTTPDIVVMELQLPSHNGIEFLHEFRSYPEWQQVPVVVNTALHLSRLQQMRPALQDELGVVEILYKPTASLADICHAVQVWTGTGKEQAGTTA